MNTVNSVNTVRTVRILRTTPSLGKTEPAAGSKIPYSHRKRYVDVIAEAKQAETRTRRIAKAVRMLAAGMKEM